MHVHEDKFGAEFIITLQRLLTAGTGANDTVAEIVQAGGHITAYQPFVLDD
jgi:hypothetical protein